MFFDKEDTITRFLMVIKEAWQLAWIVYKDPRIIAAFYDHVWSLQILDFKVRIYPIDLSTEQLELRNKFTCKVSGFLSNITTNDLQEIIIQNQVKSYFISRNYSSYHPFNFTFMHFVTAEDVENAINKCQIKLNNYTLY